MALVQSENSIPVLLRDNSLYQQGLWGLGNTRATCCCFGYLVGELQQRTPVSICP